MKPAKPSDRTDSAGLDDPQHFPFSDAVRETSSYAVADFTGRFSCAYADGCNCWPKGEQKIEISIKTSADRRCGKSCLSCSFIGMLLSGWNFDCV